MWTSEYVWWWLVIWLAVILSLFCAKLKAGKSKWRLRRTAQTRQSQYDNLLVLQDDKKHDPPAGVKDFSTPYENADKLEKGISETVHCGANPLSEAAHVQNVCQPYIANGVVIQKLLEGFQGVTDQINCCRQFADGQMWIVGTDSGVFMNVPQREVLRLKFKKLFHCKFVTQIEVLEQYDVVVVLADRMVYTFPLQAVDTGNSSMVYHGRKLCPADYISTGRCLNKTLICCGKLKEQTTTVKVYEPRCTKGSDGSSRTEETPGVWNQQRVKLCSEFFIPFPTSGIHFLRSKLCVSCLGGFQIISLQTLEFEPLLDPTDITLDFARNEASKPIYIQRTGHGFLLCYQNVSFFVDKNGARTRDDCKILWDSNPNTFTTVGDNYIVAFKSDGIEVRSTDSGELMCALNQRNARFLQQNPGNILFAFEDEMGRDVVASLSENLRDSD